MLYRLARPLLFQLSPNAAHRVAMGSLRVLSALRGYRTPDAYQRAPHEYLGLRFANRIGLAAGFDKSGRYIDDVAQLGFGFIEVGTVTPRPQPGNPPPNLFRLVEDRALINRMGFNNDGVEATVRRLEKRRYRGVCGVNIGKNFDTPLEDATSDYLRVPARRVRDGRLCDSERLVSRTRRGCAACRAKNRWTNSSRAHQ